MVREIKQYITKVEEILTKQDIDIIELKEEYLVKISFFQHERLIHLIVTLAFSLFLIGFFTVLVFTPSLPMLILTFLFFLLVIGYIRHYYFFENSIQKMYLLYDKILIYKNER